MVLTLNSDDEIVLSQHEVEDNKLWRLDEDGLFHSKTSLVVDVPGSNEDAGVALIGYHDIHGGDGGGDDDCDDGGGDDDCDDGGGDNDNGHHDIQGGDNQKFAFDGSSIRSELNGFVFDVEEGVMEEGSAVILWPHHGEDNQIFKFIEVS